MALEGPKLIAALGKELANGGAIANIELINSLPASPKAAAQQAFYKSLRTIWIMYVAFADAGLIAGFFVDAQHRNEEHEVVALGVRNDNGRVRAQEPVDLSRLRFADPYRISGYGQWQEMTLAYVIGYG
ncbi:Major facilitator superfamily domain general substrate transporter [Penicillium chermesinum]|uniref:Major facilitator superfamily domain general substrate transporter n=1 Tax=Penicillium chermesinum TaxID=63820 RepID=A0A9W9P877_9EURO|nr:Major facilitator superfamily domain general substrate transporter [Penicillium chermesinum]KAJ5239761.1 Major facilitator superfamily domain general substrate transporter [Penicillium chermesinum]KAJ6166640.1 Major facilitator superfamily domain general substrate transporter [Penicillium chermesinum]